jgi:hypothetical protein
MRLVGRLFIAGSIAEGVGGQKSDQALQIDFCPPQPKQPAPDPSSSALYIQ